MIIRSTKHNKQGAPYAKGKRAIAIDQRTGFKHLQEDMVFEPGTGYFVHEDESDGDSNLVTDPLNYTSDKMKHPEARNTRFNYQDVSLSIGAVVSAEQLSLPSYVSVVGQFFVYASVDGVYSYKFNQSKNSIYIMTRGF